ncbi:hypothetical protein [Flaviaesturariibacter terrae]
MSAIEIQNKVSIYSRKDPRYFNVYSDDYPPKVNDSLLKGLERTRMLVDKGLVVGIDVAGNGEIGYNIQNKDGGLFGMARTFLLYHRNTAGEIVNFVTNGAHHNIKRRIVIDSAFTYYSVGQPFE